MVDINSKRTVASNLYMLLLYSGYILKLLTVNRLIERKDVSRECSFARGFMWVYNLVFWLWVHVQVFESIWKQGAGEIISLQEIWKDARLKEIA
jgi:hypothetical protein